MGIIKNSAKTIVCYGDSNTWGAVPASITNERYSREIRWPGALQLLLGNDYEVINEGLCGRTLVAHDLAKPYRTGIAHLQSILRTTDPCALIIIMLGTNDIKSIYTLEPVDIVLHLEQTIRLIQAESSFLQINPKILVICPPRPVEPTKRKIDERMTRWPEFFAVLPDGFREIARKYDCYYLNAGDIVTSSTIDGYHLEPEAHTTLAKEINKIIKKIFE